MLREKRTLKRNLKIFLVVSLTLALVLPAYLSIVSSSTGNITINSQSASTVGQQVQAGGNVNLYFGGVMWSGQQFYLFLSQDGSSQVSSGLVYTPTFSVYDVADAAVHTYTSDSGAWVTGNNWINGSIPSTTGLGNYYIKAIDQIGSSVAVTDTYITVNPIVYNATLAISPSSGPGGVPITFSGQGFPASQNITISYCDPTFGTWNYMTSVTSDAQGQITVNSEVPDLQKSLNGNDYPETYSTLSYRAEIAGRAYGYANYNEYSRGLKTVGNQTAYGLYGNGTNLVSTVRAVVGDTITLSGKWFHPGVVYIRWDSSNVVGTVTSSEWLNANIIGSTATNSNGSFTTSVIIPSANAGEHYIAVEDSQTRVIVKIFISSASLQLSPSSGPGGANVQFTGSGYPASSQVTVSCLDPAFGTWNFWTTTSSDSTGKISFNGQIPDLKKSSPAGDFNNGSTPISFRTEVNGVAYSYVDYTQYWRGLKQVGSQLAFTLFGNGTNLASTVNVKPGDSLLISGKWFCPGVVYVRFDGVAIVGTVTSDEWRNAQVIGTTSASSTGSFSTSATIPTASGGEHYLSIEDSQTRIITKVNIVAPVIPTPTPTPAPNANPTPIPTPTPVPTPDPSLPTPSINLSCQSTTTVTGFKVEINGSLLLNGNALENSPVLISYSVTGGNTWESLTLVKTLSDGRFAAVWQPDVTGNYLIKATSERNQEMNEASKVINLALTPDAGQNVFSVTSNSTITQFAFNSTSKELSFIASGLSGTKGYVNIYVPKTILTDISELKAYLDGNEISFNSQSQTDSWLISFSYSHSQHTITMTMARGFTGFTQQPRFTSPMDNLCHTCGFSCNRSSHSGRVQKKNQKNRCSLNFFPFFFNIAVDSLKRLKTLNSISNRSLI